MIPSFVSTGDCECSQIVSEARLQYSKYWALPDGIKCFEYECRKMFQGRSLCGLVKKISIGGRTQDDAATRAFFVCMVESRIGIRELKLILYQ